MLEAIKGSGLFLREGSAEGDILSYRCLQQALEMKFQDLKRMSKGINTRAFCKIPKYRDPRMAAFGKDHKSWIPAFAGMTEQLFCKRLTKYLTLGILNICGFKFQAKDLCFFMASWLITLIEKKMTKLQHFAKLTEMTFNSLTQRAFRGEL